MEEVSCGTHLLLPRCDDAYPGSRRQDQDGGVDSARAGRRRQGGRCGRHRRRSPGAGRLHRIRRDHPRRRTSRHRWVRSVSAPAHGRCVGPGPDAHRPRRGGGSDRRIGHGRGRLPDQALLLRRTAGAPPGPDPPRTRREGGRPPGRLSAPRSRHPPGLARRHRDLPLRQGVLALGDVHATARARVLSIRSTRARLGLRLREPLEHHRSLHPLPARKGGPPIRPQLDRDHSRLGLPAASMNILRRFPIRLRLTLAFAVAMGVVLAIIGAFVYVGLSTAIDSSIDTGLRTRAGDITALIRQADSGLEESAGTMLGEAQNFAQVLDGAGDIVDSTPLLAGAPLLSAAELAAAAGGPTVFDRITIPGTENQARLLAVPVDAQDLRLTVVVGTSLESRDQTLSSLLAQLLLGGPIALLLTSLLAYALASAALRPVESMRREASAISAAEPGRRLPVPPARDELARLSTTLNDMLARLEAAIARERSFVSDASHELRTPLSLLKTELELALAMERPAPELS